MRSGITMKIFPKLIISRKGAKKDKKIEERENRKEKRVNRNKELYELAIDDFRLNLERLRKLYPVKTICMHGSPLSKWDNRDLWKKYDYRDFGIIAEPYFDLDFDEVFYITDTGRQWNNAGASIRDKVESSFDIEIRSTQHFIELIQQNKLPGKLIINTHPQRWTNDYIPWLSELIKQNIKNVIKKWMISRKGAKALREKGRGRGEAKKMRREEGERRKRTERQKSRR